MLRSGGWQTQLAGQFPHTHTTTTTKILSRVEKYAIGKAALKPQQTAHITFGSLDCRVSGVFNYASSGVFLSEEAGHRWHVLACLVSSGQMIIAVNNRAPCRLDTESHGGVAFLNLVLPATHECSWNGWGGKKMLLCNCLVHTNKQKSDYPRQFSPFF